MNLNPKKVNIVGIVVFVFCCYNAVNLFLLCRPENKIQIKQSAARCETIFQFRYTLLHPCKTMFRFFNTLSRLATAIFKIIWGLRHSFYSLSISKQPCDTLFGRFQNQFGVLYPCNSRSLDCFHSFLKIISSFKELLPSSISKYFSSSVDSESVVILYFKCGAYSLIKFIPST